MARFPIIQEFGTGCMWLGHKITGDSERAGDTLRLYSEESVVGSGLMYLWYRDSKYAQGLGRATGQAVLGGGMLDGVPGFHELATAGKSLGDCIGGGDTESARGRWREYRENSVFGSTIGSVVELTNKNPKRAKELLLNAGKAALSAGVTVVSTGAVVASGGAAAPFGAASAVAAGAATGASLSCMSDVVELGLYGGEPDPGAIVGGAIMGGATGAFVGYGQAKRFKNEAKNASGAAIKVENEGVQRKPEINNGSQTINISNNVINGDVRINDTENVDKGVLKVKKNIREITQHAKKRVKNTDHVDIQISGNIINGDMIISK
ncbi:hypothetical protein CAPTEDRAFT_225858 [Capitella teleta]|uniref:Uncharacterized protein n=1 Tax=Capitella teleta TaxID=283909 RepID=R7TM53_CAPTE|nr:hypothetical protein CAPTEDRAFT_225858 [Capitella teleta]|eukprot:ELT94612.1 hypothetical protein CAPTEDRAFT_225858 [Capitella teleta]